MGLLIKRDKSRLFRAEFSVSMSVFICSNKFFSMPKSIKDLAYRDAKRIADIIGWIIDKDN